MSDLMFKPAVELAALVRDGQIAATELAEIAAGQIEELDPMIGAFIEVDGERAVAAAGRIRPGTPLPLAGVPIAIKGNTPVEGFAWEFSSRFLADHRAAENAYLVRRLQNAGAIVVGITKLPEFGILPTTEPRHGGPARNPWDTSRTPGGSSGGAAAAVAAGMLPIAHANDGAGSIRIPAACCGLLGLKPTRGRVSRGPGLGDDFLTVDGVVSRSVADTALALDVMAGYEVGDSTWVPRPAEAFAVTMRRDPGRLRIAVSTDEPLGSEPDPDCARALDDATQLLAAIGHEIVEAAPPLPGPEAVAMFMAIWAPHISVGVAYGRQLAGRDPDEGEIEPLTQTFADLAASTSSTDHLVAKLRLQQIARRFVGFFADYDLLLTPVLGQRPVPIGEIHGCLPEPMDAIGRSAGFAPYTAIANITGQPAVSVPMAPAADGLPTAVQLIGPPLGEDTLLQIAAQLEAAQPWAARRPKISPAPQPAGVA